MKIDNEFTVGVPAERAWKLLTDLEGIAPCLPGAQLTGVDGDVYSGKVRVKVGPVISQYAGTAQFVEKDDAAHHAVISAKGKDSRGAGNASALIDARLRAEGEKTVVSVSTDLNITGKIAQFGSGMIKEVSTKLLGQFVENLEAELHVPAAEGDTGTATAGSPTAPAAEAGAGTGAGARTQEPAPSASSAATATTGGTNGAAAAKTPDATQNSAPATASAPRASAGESESQPLDLMGLAGSSVYKRLIPAVVGLIVVVAVVVWLVVS
ncbi:carbon monoxide dehydrogenase subunit G [Streptomyces sp. Amel2xB2]|uniref:SRPBCC family protein n=1 Tax=Streptomyces sp. Amel2xB2 TaxID=1305829 RepID=UPI000DB97E87|nr:SRPBCC family protein [Streptomyces sp. Amel2xB2]RAJ59992.1 carbon monoxide dehydrogenase subunit G [Streptomyces sp. Amel2xB2]